MTAALLLALALASPAEDVPPHVREGGETHKRLRLRLNAAATYGIGGQSFLGGLVHVVGYTPVWNTRRATGTVDLGVKLHYGNEPTWLAPWLADKIIHGSTHRVQLLLTIGHTFYMGKRRRAALGMHLFAGLNHWRSEYSLAYPSEGVYGAVAVARTKFIAGGELSFDYRLARRVGLYLDMGGPFPFQSSYVATIFSVGVGLTFYLR